MIGHDYTELRALATEPRGAPEDALATAIGRVGVWDGGVCFIRADAARAVAIELEAAGFGAVWLHEAGRDAFAGAAMLLAATSRLTVGTSIVSIWRHEPGQMAASARTLGEAFPGRFVLGLGTSHQDAASWHGRGYANPVTDMSEYLDAMDLALWHGPRPDPPVPRMLGALGPRMLALAKARCRGAIPYFGPVEHTRIARAALGPGPVLAVQMAFSIREPSGLAREHAHEYAAPYLSLPNYRNNLIRCGFREADLAGTGSERLIDALVAIGDVDDVAARVREHLDAGADHVCIDFADRSRAMPPDQLVAIAARLKLTTKQTNTRTEDDR